MGVDVGQDPAAMLIQEEPARPADPLATFDEDYEKAVLHLAWDLHAGTKERTLLFAWVELLPIEVPPPLDDGEQRKRLGGKSEHTLYLRRVVVPARQARGWYLDCRRGVAVLPEEEDGAIQSVEAGARRLALGELGEEPSWPTLLCASGSTIPFCPAWHASPRVHHLVPLADMALDKLWLKEAERRIAAQWLSERLHFRLEDYPEYWGSVHLVAPNPVYRGLDTRFRAGIPPRESIFARFQPRAGKSVEGLEFTYTDKEPWGPLDVRQAAVKTPLLRFDFERAVEGTREEVYDPKRGMLAHLEAYLNKSMSLSIDLVSQRLRVQGKKPGATYEVNRTGGFSVQMMLGNETARTSSARSRVREAHHARKKRGDAWRLGQQWFSGRQEEAVNVLRNLIHSAAHEVFLVDPYFGPDELFTFVLAVGNADVPIHILSSAECLKYKKDKDGRPILPEPGELLLANLDHVISQDHMNVIEIRVMTGDRPAVHDRFFLLDGRIWLLGSSLNEFGSRGTMMVALPDPDSVQTYLFDAWNLPATKELRSWVESRRKNRRDGAKEET
jgi:hypothetical protein